MLNHRSGFTLMELMVVVVVISILAAVAYPSYTKAIERSYWRAAQDVLMTLYSGERTYFFANNTYYNVDESVVGMAEWRKIYMDNPNITSIPVRFCVTAASATAFAAWACRTTGSCSATCAKGMSINQNRVLNTDTWPMP